MKLSWSFIVVFPYLLNFLFQFTQAKHFLYWFWIRSLKKASRRFKVVARENLISKLRYENVSQSCMLFRLEIFLLSCVFKPLLEINFRWTKRWKWHTINIFKNHFSCQFIIVIFIKLNLITKTVKWNANVKILFFCVLIFLLLH